MEMQQLLQSVLLVKVHAEVKYEALQDAVREDLRAQKAAPESTTCRHCEGASRVGSKKQTN